MIEPQENRACPICQRPKRGGAAGSITQWISVCRCNIHDSQLSEIEESLRVCADCRKRVNPTRGGTITQWIFSENFCKCENPKLVPLEPHEIEAITSDGKDQLNSEEHFEDAVLEVDPAVFPVERYRPLQFIGKGALGEVYLCKDLYLRKKVAVKCLLNLTADRIVSFQNEARIASKLNHESVISVMDFGTTEGGRPFMVMEYFPGKSLQEIISESGKIDEVDAIELFAPVCRSLIYLHESGVLHRDLKPSNVLVSVGAKGAIDVRLIDFGLSKTTQDVQSKTLIDGHTIVGTPGYMSPDQIHGKVYDARSEVYSLGCMMFETVTGSQPFQGESALEVLNNHVCKPVPSVREFAPSVSSELCKLIEKCLSKEGSDRFSSMSEVETVLASCRRGHTSEESSIDWPEHYAEEKVSVLATQPSSKSWIWVIPIVCLTIVLPIAFVCWSALRPADPNLTIPMMKRVAPIVSTDSSDFRRAVNDVSESRKAFLDVSEMDPSQPLSTPLDVGTGLIINRKGRVTQLLKDMTEPAPGNARVKLIGADIVVGDASIIASLKPVAVSILRCNGVTDGTLMELSKAPSVKMLTLDDYPQISPEGIQHLAKLPKLKVLSFRGCNLSDDHLKAMQGMKALRVVSLNRNDNLTVAGLKHLGGKTEPVSIFMDLGSLRPGASKILQECGVNVYFNQSNFR